jgi:hypothetical protein
MANERLPNPRYPNHNTLGQNEGIIAQPAAGLSVEVKGD